MGNFTKTTILVALILEGQVDGIEKQKSLLKKNLLQILPILLLGKVFHSSLAHKYTL